MEIFFRADSTSNNPNLASNIIPTISTIKKVVGDDYLLSVNPSVFVHAHMLLGGHPTRYGMDLSHYLTGIIDYFNRQTDKRTITLDFGSTDFKRRISEDMGVAIASLIMVTLYKLKWHTISQIPANNSLYKKRPDFEGFDINGDRHIYESKGTSRIENVSKFIDKALTQVKSYPEPALSKMAIVTYICNNSKAFPSYTFMIDPTMPDCIPPDEEHSIQLHDEKVLQYMGASNAAKLYLEYLKWKFRLDKILSHENIITRRERIKDKVRISHDVFRSEFNNYINKSEMYNYNGNQYRGISHKIKVNNNNITLYFGVTDGAIEEIAMGAPRKFIQDKHDQTDKEYTSVLSDGTLLLFRYDGV